MPETVVKKVVASEEPTPEPEPEAQPQAPEPEVIEVESDPEKWVVPEFPSAE